MILLVLSSRTVRAQAVMLCTEAGLACRAVSTLAAARAELAASLPRALVADAWLEDGAGLDLVTEARQAASGKSGMPALELAVLVGSSQDAPDADGGPDVWLERAELAGRLVPALRSGLGMADPESSLGSILVVDDSLTYREQLRASLEGAGYTVRTASTGEEGVRMAFEQPPDAMLVDSMLPGIDGASVIRRLRGESSTRRTPCCLLTASEDPAQELDALDAGADTFLRKDESMAVILARLAGVLRSASTPAASSLAALPQLPRRVLLVGAAEGPLSRLGTTLLDEGCETVALEPPAATPARCAQFEPDILVYAAPVDAAVLAFCREAKALPALRNSRLLLVDRPGGGTRAQSPVDALQAALQAGADDYLPPATDPAVLLARARSQLRRKRMEDENRGLREHILRQELENEAQRTLAEARSRHADEMRVASGLAERKAHEAERARLELEQITEGIPQIVWTSGPAGRDTRFNRRWRDYTGLPIAGLGAGLWRAVLHPEDRRRALRDWREADRAGIPYTSEYRLRSAAGEYRWFLVRALPLNDEAGRLDRWFGTCTDVHDQKLSEEALRRTEKLAATGRLAASIAHEINNPLEAVTNLLYLLEMHTRDDPEAHGYTLTAQKELDRVAQISKKTLAFYRESTNAGPVDLCGLVAEVADIYAVRLERKHMRLDLQGDCDVHPQGLAGELRQVLSNLVTNAIDASPMDTTIRVRVRRVTGRWDELSLPGVRVSVADHGHGIPRALVADMFKPFVTTKGAKGTGLGLWLSHSIVVRHGGRMRLRSSPAGTVFSVFLPLELPGEPAQSDSMGSMLRTIGKELLGQ